MRLRMPIELSIGAQDRQRSIQIALAEGVVHIPQHLLQPRRHHREIANVLQLDAAADRRGAITAVQQQVANALQIDDELQAGQQFARVLRSTWVMTEVTR